MNNQYQTAADTCTGFLLVLMLNISSAEWYKTTLLAAIGALTSFIVSLFLKWVTKKIRRH